MIIEIVFAAGIALCISSIIIQMRDLMQMLPLVTTLDCSSRRSSGRSPKIPDHYHVTGGHFVHKAIVAGHHIPAHWAGGSTSTCRWCTDSSIRWAR